MKRLLTLRLVLTLALLGTCRLSWGLCFPYGFSIWPATATISPNPVLLVEGYMLSQSVIDGLGVGHPVYLTSGTDTVRLALKIYQGQYQLSQALLKPVTPLIAGRTYTLHLDRLEQFQREAFESQKRSWTVTPGVDQQKPVWKAKPVYHSKTLIHYGCGPGKYVNFCFYTEDASPVLVLARVKNRTTGAVGEYLITPGTAGLRLGRGMCGGAFDFKDGYMYEAAFALLDAGGNFSATFAETAPFRAPTDADEMGNNGTHPMPCVCRSGLKAALLDPRNEPYLLLSGFILLLVLAGLPLCQQR